VIVKVQYKEEYIGKPLKKATPGASGFDLYAQVKFCIAPHEGRIIQSGIRLAIPPGYEGQIRSRSGLAARDGITVLNSPGTIDSDYRGEVMVILFNHTRHPYIVEKGDRIAQIVFAKVEDPDIQRVEYIGETERGDRGIGSTGR